MPGPCRLLSIRNHLFRFRFRSLRHAVEPFIQYAVRATPGPSMTMHPTCTLPSCATAIASTAPAATFRTWHMCTRPAMPQTYNCSGTPHRAHIWLEVLDEWCNCRNCLLVDALGLALPPLSPIATRPCPAVPIVYSHSALPCRPYSL